MTLLQRRMLRRLFLYGIALTTAASLVSLLTGTLGMTDLLTQGALSFDRFLLGMAALLPMILVVVTPLAPATSILCCYFSWHTHHEIVAFRMAGASSRTIALPGVVAALAGT